MLLDKKWSLEVAGTAHPSTLLWLIRKSLSNSSHLLKDIVYYQVARLGTIPTDVASWIRSSLISIAASGRLRHNRLTIQTHLMRLDNPSQFTNVLRLLLAIPIIDTLLHIIYLAVFVSQPIHQLSVSQIPGILRPLFEFLPYHFAVITLVVFCVIFSFGLKSISYLSLENTGDIILIFLSMRFFVLFIPLVIFIQMKISIFAALLLCIYVSTWSYVAIVCAEKGVFINVVSWPFIHILLPIYATLNIKRTFKFFLRFISRSELMQMYIIFLPAALILGGIYLLLEMIKIDLGKTIVAFLIAFFIMIGVPITFVFAVVAIIRDKDFREYLKSPFHKIQDFIYWRSWLREPQYMLSGREIIDMFRKFRKGHHLDTAVYYLRVGNFVEETEESENILSEVLIAVETLLKMEHSERRTYRNRPTSVEFKELGQVIPYFATVTTYLTKEDLSWLVNLNQEFLDETTLLLEQIRKRRQISDIDSIIVRSEPVRVL